MFRKLSRGLLHQGDLLSPLLVVIVMEGLSRLMDKATQGGLLSVFSEGDTMHQPLLVSHLLFADDTLIFCDAEPEQVTHLQYVFTWFEMIYRLKVNLSKSELVLVGEVHNLEFGGYFGLSTGPLPMKYFRPPFRGRV